MLNFLFAWRYFRAKKTTNAINIIAWVSVTAIALITAAFIVMLSVFNGFEGLVKGLYSSFYPDIRVGAVTGKMIRVNEQQFAKLAAMSSIRAYSAVVEEIALLQNGDVPAIVHLKGVDNNFAEVTQVAHKIARGRFALGTADTAAIVLGSGVEYALALDVERTIYPLTVYLFKPGVNIGAIDPYRAFAADNILAAGAFFIQQDIDSKFALTNVGFMKRMLGLKPEQFTAIEIALKDVTKTDQVKKELSTIFGSDFVIESRYEQNKSLYSVMSVEKWAIYGILTLMLIVAAFTMVGSLTMLVLEKQKDIQVLKAMGADNRLIQKIFLSEGLLLGGIGTMAGILLGLLLCWAQVKYKLITIQGGTFLIDYYPVKIIAGDFILIVATVMVVAAVASWLPSRKAALQPIELKS